MKAVSFILALGLSAAGLSAQPLPPSQTPAGSHSANLGFTYSVPHDWEVLSVPPTMDQTKSEASQNAATTRRRRAWLAWNRC